MRSFTTKVSYLLILCIFLIASCRQDDLPTSKDADNYDAKVATSWFEKFRDLTKKCPGFTPPVASRAFAYAGVALYESVVPGMPQYQSLSGQLTALSALPTPELNQEYNWAISANAAMAYMAKNLYANMPDSLKPGIDELDTNLFNEYKGSNSAETLERSKQYGISIATAIFEWSKTDGGHEGYNTNFPTSYILPTGEGYWVPTLPAFKPALQPYWGNNRNFVPNSANTCQAPTPMAYSTNKNSPFFAQGLEVYAIGTHLTNPQKTIAQFWSDDPGAPGTPPGHSISIATQVLQSQEAHLDLAAETYCKIGIAVGDAFIACWKAKYTYNLLRPVTYIRENIDSTWTPLLSTPPFPEYTSGHSVQTAATARVLSDLFGYNYTFTDRTHENRTDINGSPRTFSSFDEMAEEAAISRLYGGIHYQEAITKGIEQGKKIGNAINSLRFRPS